jgi:hypothetical protein
MSDTKVTVTVRKTHWHRGEYVCTVLIKFGSDSIEKSDQYATCDDALRQSHRWRRLAKLFAAEFEFNLE